MNVVFQYTISGEGGGEWFAEIKEGACRVEAGKHAAHLHARDRLADFLAR